MVTTRHRGRIAHRDLRAANVVLVGVERAVDAPVTTLGEETWHDVLPLVQPSRPPPHPGPLGAGGFAEGRACLLPGYLSYLTLQRADRL